MASAMWSFQQIEGKERKTLTLEAYQAPFGRPRKEPIMREVIKSRARVKYYPGSQDGATRTSFGTNWEPMELKGRWMTKRALGSTGQTANQIADDWTLFVRDERECRMSWGNILSYRCFIEELELARESEHEIAWRLKLQVDARDDVKAPPRKSFSEPIQDDLKQVQDFLATSKRQVEKVRPDMAFDFLDRLDNAAALFNYPSAVLNKAIGEITDIEKRSATTLKHFRSGVTGIHTAIVGMRDLLLNTAIDSVMTVRNAKSDPLWWRCQTDYDHLSTLVLARLTEMDRKVELLLNSEPSKLIVAREGDTWESLAVRALNDVKRAGDLRSLNGARYGEQPIVSESYLVP